MKPFFHCSSRARDGGSPNPEGWQKVAGESTPGDPGLKLIACVLAALVLSATGKAATLTEDFGINPLGHGWRIYGNTNLFHWNSTNHNLAVTWDPSQTNSYFYQPLGTILAKVDAFSLSFDLQLSAIADNSPQIAIGLFNFTSATNSTFSRPAATTPNLFELDYYADNGAGQPSIAATLTDTNVGPANKKDFNFVYDNQSLGVGANYHIVMTHTAGATNVSGQVLANGQPYSSLPLNFSGPITDFRIDTISVSSYGVGPAGTPVQGVVDNFSLTLPPPPVQNFTGTLTNQSWQGRFLSLSNWFYTLQRSADLQNWSNVVSGVSGNATNLFMVDPDPPSIKAFYRIRAERP
jgi:hypothetical protein